MNNYPNGPYPPQPGQGPYTQYPQPGYPPIPLKRPVRGWVIVLVVIASVVVICFGMLILAAIARNAACNP